MLALLSLLACSPNDASDGPEWVVTWADEFLGPAGQPPNPDKWTFDVGGDGWGNSQLEFNTDRPENVSLDGEGLLNITAIEEEYQGNAYTSARIKTDGLFDQAYGRFEARIRLPRGQGLWPAFWLLGSEFEDIGWPWCGEVDIMEARGQEPSTVHGTIHGPGYSGASGIGDSFTLDEGSFAGGFHTFAVEIDEGHISWFVDDILYNQINAGDLGADATWVNDDPFFLILNLAVGGAYLGDPDESTEFPATMQVDWVRVSERVW